MFGRWSYSPYKRRGHRSGPYSPYKMPKNRLCKMPRHRSGPCKNTDTSGACKMHGQRSGPSDIPEQRSGGSKMHGFRSGPYKMHQHRSSPYKMPRHRLSCKASVCAIRRRGSDAVQSPMARLEQTRARLWLAAWVQSHLTSHFLPYWINIAQDGDVQFVRVLHSKFAAGISDYDEEIQQRERR
jgi:hypothetical protein